MLYMEFGLVKSSNMGLFDYIFKEGVNLTGVMLSIINRNYCLYHRKSHWFSRIIFIQFDFSPIDYYSNVLKNINLCFISSHLPCDILA